MKELIAVACGVVALTGGAFELGQSDATIWTSKENRPAATELSENLAKVFGKAFAVKDAPKAITDQKGIFVGIVPPDYRVTWDATRDCSVRIVEKDRVWLFGNDGKEVHGTANAVYDFLERYAGVRWLWPGELGTVADPQGPVAIPDESVSYVPPFRRRLTSSFSAYLRGMTKDEAADLSAWMRHRRVGSSLTSRGASGFQHSFSGRMPRAKYGKEHPEYYALVSPERWIGEPKPTEPTRLSDSMMPGPWQVCTSNPDVRRIFAEQIIAAKTEDIMSISPNDGYGFCECPACRAQDPEGQGIGPGVYDVTDRMYDFLSDIAWQVYKASPTSKVGLFSYSFYDKVPVKKFNLPPNVYLSCCYLVYRMNRKQEAELAEKLTGLSRMGAQIVGREYWGTHYTMRYPLSHSRKIDRNLKLLHKLGAAGIYGETGASFGVRATDLYLLALLAWDPTADRAAALADFCTKAFGPKAGPVMYELFESIEDRVESKVETLADDHAKAFAHYRNTYADFNRFMATIFDDGFSAMCEKGCKKALKLADTPVRKARIDYFAAGLGFAKLTTESLRSLGDLAACGNDVPLTMPSDNEIRMEKSVLIKVANRAIDAENGRRRFPLHHKQSNILTSDMRSEALSLRPWRTMAERARQLLRSDRYNYLVNGSFEYSGYSWDVSGDGTNVYSTARNHDADDNWMVQYHHKQGISLELNVAPHGTMRVRNLRKVSPAEPRSAVFAMFVRSERDPLPFLKVTFGGQELKGFDVSRDVPLEDHWHELRFRPVRIPAGDHVFEIVAANPGDGTLTLNFDNLDLRLVNPVRSEPVTQGVSGK